MQHRNTLAITLALLVAGCGSTPPPTGSAPATRQPIDPRAVGPGAGRGDAAGSLTGTVPADGGAPPATPAADAGAAADGPGIVAPADAGVAPPDPTSAVVGAPCGPGPGGGRGMPGGSPLPAPTGDGPGWFLQPCGLIFSAPAGGFFDTPPNGLPLGTAVSQTLIIANTSKKTPLALTSIAVEGPDAADFVADAGMVARALGAPLPANESKGGLGDASLAVVFTPSAEGPRSAILRVVSDAGTALVPLFGKGLPGRPVATVGPAPVTISFPALATAPGKVVIENSGGKPLLIQSMTFQGADAAAFRRAPVDHGTGNCMADGGDTLAPLGYCAIGIEVVPGTAGPRTATYVIETNDPLTPTVTVPLSLGP